MKLHAGSLYRDILVLYSQERTRTFVVQIIDEKRQWDIYCNDVELSYEEGSAVAELRYEGEVLHVPFWEINIKNRVGESINIADHVIVRA